MKLIIRLFQIDIENKELNHEYIQSDVKDFFSDQIEQLRICIEKRKSLPINIMK
jgi:hypothetical protein